MADYILGHTGDNIEYKLDVIDQYEAINTSADEAIAAYDAKKARCVREMNIVTREGGLTNSTWKTPTGGMTLHPGEQYQGSLMPSTTAEDLVRLGIMARHNPLVYAGMSCHQYTAKINGADLTVKHSVLENNTWKNWAAARGLTLIAAKTGSNLDTSYSTLADHGVLATSILLGYGGATYIVGEVGMDYRSAASSEDHRKRRAAIYGAFCRCVWGDDYAAHLTEDNDLADFLEVESNPKIGLMCVKLKSNGTFDEDAARINDPDYCWSQNKDVIRGAASTTKLALATAVACHFVPYESITTVPLDLTGGSGLDEEDMPVGSTLSAIDALYICLMRSDNTLANTLSRVVGQKLSADYSPERFTATMETELPIQSFTSGFRAYNALNACGGALSFTTNNTIAASTTAKVVAKIPAKYAPFRTIPLSVRSYSAVSAAVNTSGEVLITVGTQINNNAAIYIGGFWPMAD